MDVLVRLLDILVAAGGRLALLGSGDAALEAAFTAAAVRRPGRVGVRIGYDEACRICCRAVRTPSWSPRASSPAA